MSRETQEDERNELERMTLALRASNEGIWDWKPGERGIYYSRRVLEFLECPASSAPNLFLSPHDSIHPEERGQFENAIRQALDPGGPEKLSIDCRVLTGSGGWRWLRVRGAVVRGRDGHAMRIAGSMIDISLRKAAESQVEEERHLLRQLIDHVPLQIYFKDLDSRFVLANRRMAKWVKRETPQQLIGKHDRDFFDELHAEEAARDERRILETGDPILDLLECETWSAEGCETWVQTSKFPWRDVRGRLKGTFGVSSDVTDLVVAQQEASALAGELAKRNQVYEEELQLAREIQQALASGQFPEVRHAGTVLGFGARYVPISGLAGDFFEVVPISPDSAGLLICDVMGHGVRSALIVAMLRGLLEKQRAQAADPAAFLHGLNEGLCSILIRARATMFATAFYAVIDLKSGSLSYACAGHPGAVVAGSSGVRQIAGTRSERGPGLGLIPHAVYPSNTLPLDGVDRMVMFTDGILEAQNEEGECFFEERLLEAVADAPDGGLDELLDGILKRVLEFSESLHFDDDVCLLGLELKRLPAVARVAEEAFPMI
jgi:sigma-B regulation protein RsbU (phosphoserine phosphatase)